MLSTKEKELNLDKIDACSVWGNINHDLDIDISFDEI
jgi:hypothetical protein